MTPWQARFRFPLYLRLWLAVVLAVAVLTIAFGWLWRMNAGDSSAAIRRERDMDAAFAEPEIGRPLATAIGRQGPARNPLPRVRDGCCGKSCSARVRQVKRGIPGDRPHRLCGSAAPTPTCKEL